MNNMFKRYPGHRDFYPLFTLLIFLVLGCFEPEGENFVVVEEASFEGANINLANVDGPVYIYRPTTLSYDVNQEGAQLIRLEGTVGWVSIVDPKEPGKLFIDPAKFDNGTHTLTITATFLGQSQSLASRLGKEEKSITKQFNIVVDLELTDPLQIKSIAPEDGFLYVRWDAPKKLNFLRYRVKRFIRDHNNEWKEYYMQKPWNLEPASQYFRDSLYTGGEIRYQIDMVGYRSTREGLPMSAYYEGFQTEIQQINDWQVLLKWSRSPFYKCVSKLRLTTYLKPDQDFAADQPGEIIIDAPFGKSTRYSLSAFAKYGAGWTKYLNVYTGEALNFDGVTDLKPYSLNRYGSKELLISSNFSPPDALLINPETRAVEKRVEFDQYYRSAGHKWSADHSLFGKSFDGKHFYLFTGVEVIQFDENMDYVKTIDFTEISPGFSSYFTSIEVSNGGVACFFISAHTVSVFDLQNSTTITKTLPHTYIPPHISPDSKYFFYDGLIYDITNRDLNQVAELSDREHIRDAVFSSNSDRLFVVYKTGRMDVVDLSSFGVTGTFAFQGDPGLYVSVDPVTGYVGFSTGGTEPTYFVVDPTTNSLVKSLKIANNSDLKYHVFNNRIYSAQGFVFPL